jgi:hypothetical protein
MVSVRVKFLVNRTVRDFRAGTADEESYKAGKVYTLPESSAMHWCNRQVAEVVADEPKPKAKPKAETKSAAKTDDDAKDS